MPYDTDAVFHCATPKCPQIVLNDGDTCALCIAHEIRPKVVAEQILNALGIDSGAFGGMHLSYAEARETVADILREAYHE